MTATTIIVIIGVPLLVAAKENKTKRTIHERIPMSIVHLMPKVRIKTGRTNARTNSSATWPKVRKPPERSIPSLLTNELPSAQYGIIATHAKSEANMKTANDSLLK